MSKVRALDTRGKAALDTPTDLSADAVSEISEQLNAILADDVCALPQDQEFPLACQRPALPRLPSVARRARDQLFGATDEIAERVRKIGGTTVRSIGHIAKLQRMQDNDAILVADDMLASSATTTSSSSKPCGTHGLCDEHGDVASASLIEFWIDEAERRTWFLFEATRNADDSGH